MNNPAIYNVFPYKLCKPSVLDVDVFDELGADSIQERTTLYRHVHLCTNQLGGLYSH